MKKAFSCVYSIVIMLALVASCFTASAASTESNKRAVFDFLTGEAGLNSAAACGIMANIEHESNFNPTTVARDRNGLLSGGLCMWNGVRFKNLQNFCNKNGYNYLSVNGQLRFLMHELRSDSFRHIYSYLKNVSNSASGAYDAAYYWCYYFEIPSNRASKSAQRGAKARDSYWPVYGKTLYTAAQTPLSLSCSAAGKTVDAASKVTFSWTGGASYVENYYLCIKQPGQEKYTKISVNGAKKYTLNLKGRKTGSYCVFVIGKDSGSSTVGKASKVVSFTVKCLGHDYEKTAVKKPTKTENGKIVYTCTKCGAKTSSVVLSYNRQNLSKQPLQSLTVSAAVGDRIGLKWSGVKGADGYFVFQASGNKWVLIKTLPADSRSVTVTGLKPNTAYRFLVRAYAGSATNKKLRVLSGYKTVTVTTAPSAPVLTGVFRPAKGQAALTWTGSGAADGYLVYYSYSKNGSYKQLANIHGRTGYVAKNLKSGKTVYFKVCAYKNGSPITAFSNFSNGGYALIK